MRRYPAEALHELASLVLEGAGATDTEAGMVAEHLVAANLAGHDSHGVGMLPAYVDFLRRGLFAAGRVPNIVHEAGAVVVVDAARGLGPPAAVAALDRGIARAREMGAAIVALRNSAHIGRIGAYSEYCAAAGLASLHLVNVVDHDPVVAPFGGSDARFVTNPVSASVPASSGVTPLLDMATSTIALGKARVARNRGVAVPDGALLDAAGRPTTDPAGLIDRHEGALTAFGQHKGSGLAIICEVFAGALTGGRTVQPGHERKGSVLNNMLSVLVDPSALGEPDAIADEVGAFMAYLKASPPAPGVTEVLAPGEPEARARTERGADGIPIEPMTIDQLRDAAASVGLAAADVDRLLGG